MQQTTNYNFNIIDPRDDFSPDPLNRNTRAVEDKLAALETADAALAQADADNKSQLQAAIQSAQSAAGAALETKAAQLQAALSAHAADTAQHAFVKLGKLEIPAGQTGTLSIADPMRYTCILSSIHITDATTAGINVTAGGGAVGTVSTYSKISPGTHALHFLLPQGWTRVSGYYLNADGSTLTSTALGVFSRTIAWSSVKSMSYGGCGAAAIVTVYALLA